MFLSSYWSICRKSFLPLAEINGKISEHQNNIPMKIAEMDLLSNAINIIEKANNFRGILYYYDNYPQTLEDSPLVITFSILFPSEKELFNFVAYLRDTL